MPTEDRYAEALESLRGRAPDLARAVAFLNPTFDGTYTVVVDPDGIKVQARWFDGLDDEERVSVLATLGFRLTSPLLRPCGDRDGFVWNLACSAITNANLAALGFRLPKGALLEPSCRYRTSDDVYETIRGVPGLVPARREDVN